MNTLEPVWGEDSPVVLEINANHAYKAEEMGVLEFRITNRSLCVIRSLELVVHCHSEPSPRRAAPIKNLAPAAQKMPFFQIEPLRGGEALLDIEISVEDDHHVAWAGRGHTTLSISSKEDRRVSLTSFNLDFHDIRNFQGNDLSEMVRGAGKEKEIDEGRLRDVMKSKQPFWMRVALETDEQETARRRDARRQFLFLPPGLPPLRTHRALLESVKESVPQRVFLYSTVEVRFGRNAQKNEVVLRFLPDFCNDERSKTISGEQFIVRHSEGQCVLALTQESHAPMTYNGTRVQPGEGISLCGAGEIKIGSREFTLKISCAPRDEDPHWVCSREEVMRSDPGDDSFSACPWDLLTFSRTTNGPEEEYLWLIRKMDIDWKPGADAGIRIGHAAGPKARLSSWGGRYYLEALDLGSRVTVTGHLLEPNDIVRLGAEADVSFGDLQFHWKSV